MKFGVDRMPLRTTLKSYFQFPMIGNTNMADKQTCEVRLTLAALALGHLV
jgi:hypothetical protein